MQWRASRHLAGMRDRFHAAPQTTTTRDRTCIPASTRRVGGGKPLLRLRFEGARTPPVRRTTIAAVFPVFGICIRIHARR
jgi:hypothetical protein